MSPAQMENTSHQRHRAREGPEGDQPGGAGTNAVIGTHYLHVPSAYIDLLIATLYIETDRQTDRLADRDRDTKTDNDRQTETETDRLADRQRQIQRERETDRQTERDTERERIYGIDIVQMRRTSA